ncbi:hypothetical protein BAUCODRAFT_27634 [Baudoinia panamericana UAMH 10762]|uniref:Uncharacterized protein n=1 Tax=Baudoinia panamericana (strain UAMH 10762) TaxID=717646 RepID=M2LEB4_BAUPA|nr:uncharacterized protein BAUCODRAFT_27634 [Baudoinia panamericana UAMH 10762]EMC92332.1 hypothetical protein BAUCODRAFT_27634 [Baudoinia panamericana UAMH 10762]
MAACLLHERQFQYTTLFSIEAPCLSHKSQFQSRVEDASEDCPKPPGLKTQASDYFKAQMLRITTTQLLQVDSSCGQRKHPENAQDFCNRRDQNTEGHSSGLGSTSRSLSSA